MEYVVVAAEVLTVLWIASYFLMIKGFVKEGIKAAYPQRDPLIKFFLGNAKWAIFTGIASVYIGSSLLLANILLG